MNASELIEKNTDELNAELVELRKEQFNLRMQRATNQSEQTHNLKNVRRNIARVKTILNQNAQTASAEQSAGKGEA
ncbi:MAG: 50S ribosomal protein L29 [Kangiellaceae bacterium]